MFKTRYTVTTEGSRTVVRRVGKSRTTVIARRIPLSPAQSSANAAPKKLRGGRGAKRKARRKKP